MTLLFKNDNPHLMRDTFIPVLLSTLFICLISSCANYKNNYILSEQNWRTNNLLPDSMEVVYTIYLLGDAGLSPIDGVAPAVKYFNKMLAEAPKNSAAILLGDNIYPKGLPKKSAGIAREEAQHNLEVQLEGLRSDNFKGTPIIVMGNHDYGQKRPIEGVKRQEKFIHNYLGNDSVVFPKAGCGDPTTVELTDDLVVICLDSQWWIEDWSKLPDINDGCDVTTREVFMDYFEDQITDHKGKNILVALHHPPYTNGSHGGQYPFLSSIFPLRDLNKNLWIPFPLLGNIINATRSSVGTETDVNDPRYKGLAQGIVNIAEKHDSVLFVSGHEHTLQYLEIKNQKFIVSGSGAKSTATRAGNGALFTTSKMGHVVVKIYEDGSMWGEHYAASDDGETGTLVYRNKIKGALPVIEAESNNTITNSDKFLPYRPGQTAVTSVYPDSLKLSLDRAIFGNYNSDLFFTKVEAPVLLLDKHLGGLEIVKTGGSTQTVSLRLKDKQGRSYVLRSLRKDPTRSLPAGINFPLSQKLMSHFLTGANPFGAFAVPDLAEAIGIYHTNPKLFYMPKHAALGRFNDRYGDQLFLLEERPDESWNESGIFGKPKDVISHRKLFHEFRTENDKVVKVNQELALRNRLLDILIGDFDRHMDQFRFGKRVMKDSFVYDPIPRDRDLAFSSWDGLAFRIGTLIDPKIRASHSYSDEIKSMKWLNYQSRGFDKSFLNTISKKRWLEIAADMQEKLTDEVIEQALKKMPLLIYEKQGEKIRKGLRARRNDLLKHAEDYYELVNKVVEILGTDENDTFEVKRLPEGKTKVTAWTSNEKLTKKKIKFYERTFNPDVTKEIRIFGMDDEDLFTIDGEVDKGIKVRLVGGFENDTFIDRSKVKGLKKKTIINDAISENRVEGSKETKDKRSTNNLQNSFIFLKGELGVDYVAPFFDGGFNPDDGTFLGVQLNIHDYPYRVHHVQQISANYAFATGAFNIRYKADFESIFNNEWDLLLNGHWAGDQFIENYFGFGNESVLTEESKDDFDFNRVRLEQFSFRPSLKKDLLEGSYFSFGLLGETFEVEETENRILSSDLIDVDPAVFNSNVFAGVEAGLTFNFVDDFVNPANGIRFNAGASWRANVQNFDRNYVNLNTALTFYQGWGQPRRLVFASRMGWGRNIGETYFYQGVTLGGNDNLRGVRQNRFTGDAVFYHNTDLRLRLFTSENNVLPFSLGILGGFDYGRVWETDVKSDKWHYGYGGGLWISPLDVIVLNASLFKSREDQRFVFRLGYSF